MHAWLIAQILQFSKLERFMSVTSRQVTANVRLWLYVESLQVIVSILIQYIRYVYETPNLSPFCTFSVLFCRQAGEFGPLVQTRCHPPARAPKRQRKYSTHSHSIRGRLSWRSRAYSHYEIRPGGPPWWGLEAMPAPPGHRCDQTSLPARPQGATFTGQPAACSRYTAVTLNKPLDFERGGQFFRAIILHAVTRNHRRPAGRPAMHAAMQISGLRTL